MRFSFSTIAIALGLGLLLTGCQALSQKAEVDFATPKTTQPVPVPMVATPTATGSLYSKVSYRPAFEDPRARAVGDTVTIQIMERVTASQTTKSSADRTSSISAGVSAFPVISVGDLAKLSIGANTGNTFSGKGDTENANTFSGTITATVVEVLPNGHLVVAGEKQIGVNQNVDVLRFSGTVDPRVVQPGSIVNSNQVANARILSKGRGPQAEAQTVGWLSRFFLSFMPF